MSNSSLGRYPRSDNLTSTNGKSKYSNNQNQKSTHSLPRSPWVGIKQYTNEFSSKKANPGYIARARLIYNKLCSELNVSHTNSGYVAIEPESGEYFINENKKKLQNEAYEETSRTVSLYFSIKKNILKQIYQPIGGRFPFYNVDCSRLILL